MTVALPFLLQKVSELDPEMRVRFTSPHPKDFPDEVLTLIKEKANICKQLHLPAQSGNSRILVLFLFSSNFPAFFI
jgi:tRNA A37 methylthiotransferase MiaB